jgi:hypothetical protein
MGHDPKSNEMALNASIQTFCQNKGGVLPLKVVKVALSANNQTFC